jgi:hypothetical protein
MASVCRGGSPLGHHESRVEADPQRKDKHLGVVYQVAIIAGD